MAYKEDYSKMDGVWRTIGGRRVFIKKGQSLSEAMRESGKFGKLNKTEKNIETTISKEEEEYKKRQEKIKELEEKIKPTIKKQEVISVVDENGNVKFVGLSNSGNLVLTNDENKALLSTNQRGQHFKEQLLEKGYKENVYIRETKKEVPYSIRKPIEEEIFALKMGFNSYEEYSAHQKILNEKRIQKLKNEYEKSYVSKIANKKYEVFNSFYNPEDREDNYYNQIVFSEAIVRKAKQLFGVEERHSSATSGSKFGDSIYLVDKETGIEVRLSNHSLPETDERAYNRERYGGTRWDKEVVLDQYTMSEIASLKTEKEFNDYLKQLFGRN
jgi:hypothetical protein